MSGPLFYMTLAEKISTFISGFDGVFSMESIYKAFPEEKETTLRGRVYRELMGRGEVERIGRGLYRFKGSEGQDGIILNGDARDLSIINDESAHLVMADHPYKIESGRSRNFNKSYADSSFEYEQRDFDEKARVLIDGGFLVEFLPEVKDSNAEYLNDIRVMAKRAGLHLYCKIPWFKARIDDGRLVNMSPNVGRKSVMEDVWVFCKGKPRSLRERAQGAVVRLERGAKKMFPAVFMHTPITPTKRKHQSEKPISLLKEIIDALSNEGEMVIDQFAGSFNTFFAALELGRKAIAFEINEVFLPFESEAA